MFFVIVQTKNDFSYSAYHFDKRGRTVMRQGWTKKWWASAAYLGVCKHCEEFLKKLNIEYEINKDAGYPRLLYKKLNLK